MKQDLPAAVSYRKAYFALSIKDAMEPFREAIGKNHRKSSPKINAKTASGIYWQNVEASVVLKSKLFKQADRAVMTILYQMFNLALIVTCGISLAIFCLWWKFGKGLQSDRKIRGGEILSAAETASRLYRLGRASDLKIGRLPIVKDSETRHFLICGSTGSGKTNLIDCFLPQIETRKQPAIIVDQTGEMIAKYYNPARGDIIFNPLDDRSHFWDFWSDCSGNSEATDASSDRLEKFAKILFSFNRRVSGSSSDPFWENSAEVIFTSAVMHLFKQNKLSIEYLLEMLTSWSPEYLSHALAATPAARYLTKDNRITASSILSVLATSIKPLKYLKEPKHGPEESEIFTLSSFIKEAQNGKESWLFLSAKPSARELTLPLISCLLELSIAMMMDNINQKSAKIWFVLDELAALGKLPALGGLMSEGRKYGACVIAAMQSLNQLYAGYGQYLGSTLFGQFGSKFFFKNDEPQIAKMIIDLCGTSIINRQLKNTSFGASELRDGVSYTEQEKTKNLVEYSDLASLKVGECFALLPEPEVRLSRLQVPENKIAFKNQGFVLCNKIKLKPATEQTNNFTTAREEAEDAEEEEWDLIEEVTNATKVNSEEILTQEQSPSSSTKEPMRIERFL
jgi:type IV conjugative transfer system coupling protein TraD